MKGIKSNEPFCSHLQSLMKKVCSILKGHNSFRIMSQKEVDILNIEQDGYATCSLVMKIFVDTIF